MRVRPRERRKCQLCITSGLRWGTLHYDEWLWSQIGRPLHRNHFEPRQHHPHQTNSSFVRRQHFWRETRCWRSLCRILSLPFPRTEATHCRPHVSLQLHALRAGERGRLYFSRFYGRYQVPNSSNCRETQLDAVVEQLLRSTSRKLKRSYPSRLMIILHYLYT